MGHRPFFPMDHTRQKSRKFDGKVNRRSKTKELSGIELLKQLECSNATKLENILIIKRENVPQKNRIGLRKVYFLSCHTGAILIIERDKRSQGRTQFGCYAY